MVWNVISGGLIGRWISNVGWIILLIRVARKVIYVKEVALEVPEACKGVSGRSICMSWTSKSLCTVVLLALLSVILVMMSMVIYWACWSLRRKLCVRYMVEEMKYRGFCVVLFLCNDRFLWTRSFPWIAFLLFTTGHEPDLLSMRA